MSNDPTPQQPVQQQPGQHHAPQPHTRQQHPPHQHSGHPYAVQPVPVRRPSFFARHKVLTVFLAIFALIVVVSIASSLGGGDTTTADPADTGSQGVAEQDSGAGTDEAAPAEPAPAEPAPGIGAPVRDGKFEFTVTAVEPGVASVGDEFLNVEAQGQFVLVHVTVTNIGDAAQMFDSSSQKLFDGQGREHSADSTAGIYLGDAKSFLNDINPGNSIQGVVVFDIPADAAPVSIELHDSFLSGGTTVALG